jgi:hypothetical protein
MRVLIRDLETRLFYGPDGNWVTEHLEARNFLSPDAGEEEAIRLSKQDGKKDLELLVLQDDGRPRWGRRLSDEAAPLG